MEKPTPTTCQTTNWPAYDEALERRGALTIRFDPKMKWAAAPTGKRGRRQTDSDAAVRTCLAMKVLFGMVDIDAPSLQARCRRAGPRVSFRAG